MKIAIHHRKGSFSDRWIEYCIENNVQYIIVNAFDSNIIEQVRDYDIFLWHHHHGDYKDVLVAKKILYALEQAGKIVFPNFNTGWHFDDKVAQKYLLGFINAPLVPSYIFYEKDKAVEWAKNTSYPKVFKLKGGAGSMNVSLVKNQRDCLKLINKAFKKGFSQYNTKNAIKDDLLKLKETKQAIYFVKAISRFIRKPKFAKAQTREKGYVYFQDFIPNNDSDLRIICVGEKAFALKRMIREDDFRASGSGNIIYDHTQICSEAIKISFETMTKMKASCRAFHYVFDGFGKALIVEIS